MGQHTSWGAERCREVRRPATCSQQVCLHEGLSGPRSGPGTCRKGQRAAGALLVIAGGFQKARLGERGTGWSEEKWSGRSPTVWVVTPAMCMSWVGGGAAGGGCAPGSRTVLFRAQSLGLGCSSRPASRRFRGPPAASQTDPALPWWRPGRQYGQTYPGPEGPGRPRESRDS